MSLPKRGKTRWPALVLLVVVVFLVLTLIDQQWEVEALAAIFLGWLQYPADTLSRAHYYPGKIAEGLGYAAALVVGSHLFLRWLYRETTGGGRWRIVWTLSCATIVLLMFVSGMAAIGIVHQTAWLATSPVPLVRADPRYDRTREQCASHLHQIGLAIFLYQNDHNGRYPDDLAALIEQKLDPSVFVCPAENAEPSSAATTQALRADLAQRKYCSYIYYGKGLSDPVDPGAVIATERLTDHGDAGINVLFGDGHAEWVEHDAAVKLLAKLAATLPTTGPTTDPGPTSSPTNPRTSPSGAE